MPKLYIFHIKALYDAKFECRIGIICMKNVKYLDRLMIGCITNAFSYFSQSHDYLESKEVIDISDYIYNHIKRVFNVREENRLEYNNGNYCLSLGNYRLMITNYPIINSERIKYDRIGIY